MGYELNAVALTVFVFLFLVVTVLGFVAARWRRGDLDLLDEWGVGGRRFGVWVTWFPVGGDIYTAYTFFAVPYTILIFPLMFLVLPRLWAVAKRGGEAPRLRDAGKLRQGTLRERDAGARRGPDRHPRHHGARAPPVLLFDRLHPCLSHPFPSFFTHRGPLRRKLSAHRTFGTSMPGSARPT